MIQTRDLKNVELHSVDFSHRQWRHIVKMLGLDKDEQKRALWVSIEVGEITMRLPREENYFYDI